MIKPNTVWGYYWDDELHNASRSQKKLLRVSAAIPGGVVGNECNLKCVFCFTNCGTRFSSQKCIDNEMVLRFLKDASRFAYDKTILNYFLVSEGEPTLNPDIIPMLKEICSWGGTVTIFSNLLELSSEQIETFVKLKNLFVCGKLYGITAETNDSLTGVPGSYEKMMKNIVLLSDLGVASEGRLGVQCVMTSRNYEELFDIFTWGRQNNVVPHLMMFRRQGKGEQVSHLDLSADKVKTFYDKCLDYDRKKGYDWESLLPLLIHGVCRIPGINLYLANNGDIKICACDEQKIGNYFYDKLDDVIKSERFLKAVETGSCLWFGENTDF